MVIDPRKPQNVYAGAGFSGAVLKSPDGGASWRIVGLKGNDVGALAIDPRNSRTIHAGTLSGISRVQTLARCGTRPRCRERTFRRWGLPQWAAFSMPARTFVFTGCHSDEPGSGHPRVGRSRTPRLSIGPHRRLDDQPPVLVVEDVAGLETEHPPEDEADDDHREKH